MQIAVTLSETGTYQDSPELQELGRTVKGSKGTKVYTYSTGGPNKKCWKCGRFMSRRYKKICGLCS